MSRIDELVHELCATGVDFKELGDLLDYEQPTKYLVESARYDDSQSTPVLTAGRTFILGYTQESAGIYAASKGQPVMIFDDFTTAFHWVDFPFKAKSSAMKMLRPKTSTIDFRYVYYAMRCIRFSPTEHTRHWISQYSRFQIPLPPLDVQREVVRILDALAEAEADLETEIESEVEARRHQYEHYRDHLLRRVDEVGSGFQSLRSLVGFTNGKPHERLVDSNGSIALMTARFISTQGRSARRLKLQDVLTPAHQSEVALVMSDLPGGRALARAFYVDSDNKYAANQRVCLLGVLDQRVISPRFLYYVIDRNDQLLSHDNGVDQTHLKKDWILDVRVPLPPLEQQERIVIALDKLTASLDGIVNDLSSEVAARRKQYEHYRDRLLTFPEAS